MNIKVCSGSGLIQSTKREKVTKSHFHTNLKIKLIQYLPKFKSHCILILHQVTFDSIKTKVHKFFYYSVNIIFGLSCNKINIYEYFITHGITCVVFYFALAIREVKVTVVYSQKSAILFFLIWTSLKLPAVTHLLGGDSEKWHFMKTQWSNLLFMYFSNFSLCSWPPASLCLCNTPVLCHLPKGQVPCRGGN